MHLPFPYVFVLVSHLQMIACKKRDGERSNVAAFNEVFLTALASNAEDGCLQVMQHMQLFLTSYDDSSILLFIDVMSNAIFVVGRAFNVVFTIELPFVDDCRGATIRMYL